MPLVHANFTVCGERVKICAFKVRCGNGSYLDVYSVLLDRRLDLTQAFPRTTVIDVAKTWRVSLLP